MAEENRLDNTAEETSEVKNPEETAEKKDNTQKRKGPRHATQEELEKEISEISEEKAAYMYERTVPPKSLKEEGKGFLIGMTLMMIVMFAGIALVFWQAGH